jgi:two-component system, cell cycle sensor histidine kinase and response regulator CckA
MTSSLQTDPAAVLVVDDDNGLLRTLSDILRLHGHEALTAPTAAEGLALLQCSDPRPAIALIDLRLPDMDGLELAARLRAACELTQVVILTGNASVETAVRAMREQSCDYLVKPVAPDLLLRTVAVAGERWHRQVAEEALRQNEERFRRLIENVADVIMVLDAAGTVRYVSPSVTRLLDAAPEQLEGAAWVGLLHPSDVKPAHEFLARVAGEPSVVHSLELRIRANEGVWRITECVAHNLLAHPTIEGIVVAVRDVTERKSLEVRLVQAQKMESVGRLAGGVAHDFNNVLTVILSSCELARSSLTPSHHVVADLDEISRASRHARDLTRQLLAFSRRQALAPRAVGLNDLIEGMTKLLGRVMGDDITLDTRLAHDLWHTRADPSQIEQVMVNLAVNARDAMPEGGTLSIATTNLRASEVAAEGDVADRDFVRMTIRDTGSGMDAATLNRIFEPFFTTKGPDRGTGLGLATVYGIVKQSGGQIGVDSAPGRGTTFTIDLPRTEEAPDDAHVDDPASRSVAGSETILIVDDNEAVRGVTGRTLRRHGYQILTAATPEEAIRVASEHPGPLHLLLTDLMMPGMNGRELARFLTERNAGLRVVLTSGYPGSDPSLQVPNTAFLQKPYAPAQLAECVRRTLDAPSLEPDP